MPGEKWEQVKGAVNTSKKAQGNLQHSININYSKTIDWDDNTDCCSGAQYRMTKKFSFYTGATITLFGFAAKKTAKREPMALSMETALQVQILPRVRKPGSIWGHPLP
jgi:hypothetical protein